MRGLVSVFADSRGRPVLQTVAIRPGKKARSFQREIDFYLLVTISNKIYRMQREGRYLVFPLTDGYIGWEARIY